MDDIRTLPFSEFPSLLREIPDAPKKLYVTGAPIPDIPKIAVVGSRKFSEYGKRACEALISGLARFDAAIVSGCAIGIDSIAHRAALDAGLVTIGVPGSPIDEKSFYPRSHRGLRREILESGGTILSEFKPGSEIYPSNFPQRNRIMAGMCEATLIVEAAARSGTLITARLAMEYNREVLTVPGSIFSKTSFGPHLLIKDGAHPVTSADDIVEILSLEKKEAAKKDSRKDNSSDGLDFEDSIDKDAFVSQFKTAAEAQKKLTELELLGHIEIRGTTIYRK